MDSKTPRHIAVPAFAIGMWSLCISIIAQCRQVRVGVHPVRGSTGRTRRDRA